MKLKLKVLAALLAAVIMLPGCASSPKKDAVSPSEPAVSESKTSKKAENKKKEPEDPPDVAFAKKLQAKLENGDLDGAIALFDEIPADIAGTKDMNILHASLLISAGNLEKASVLGKELEDAYPEDVEILEMNAIIAKNSGNNASYKSYSNKILALDPYNSAMNIQAGQEYALNKKWKQARNYYKKALVNDPNNLDALFGCGLMNYYIGEVGAARDSFQKILEIDPHNAMALAYMGKLAADNENYLSAVKYIQEAIKYDDSNYDFYMDYGSYLNTQNRKQEAIAQWEKARDLDPEYFLAYAYLAGINDELGNFDTALENYRKVIETNPDYYYAFESAACLEWHAGNWAEAREDFYKAYVTGGSTNWSYALMIAATYMKEKNQFKAREWLNPIMKKMNRESIEYQMMKFYYDNFSKNAANALAIKISKEESTTKRGKLNFYFGLYNELFNATEAASDYYLKVTSMQAPMFFEYRLAEWALGK